MKEGNEGRKDGSELRRIEGSEGRKKVNGVKEGRKEGKDGSELR